MTDSFIEATINNLMINTVQVLPLDELRKKLEKKERLKIKLGMDPTAPDLHLGHLIVLLKLKQFQDLGHEVIFLIGDFTTRIGDPTGKSKTRPALKQEEIEHNMRTYFDQVGKVLDLSRVTIDYNSSWLGKLTSADLVQLCAKVTLGRLIERDDFAKRIQEQQSIGFHELLYPLMQGYDSVALCADVELGGTDQTFNLLMGRLLQEQYGQEQQVIMTVPLLLGLDGVHKMSKSLHNAIGITEEPRDVFGKLMSISDTLMWHYFERLLHYTPSAIDEMQKQVASGFSHPMVLKKKMAHDIIKSFWSENEAIQAQKDFEAVFQRKDYSHAQEIRFSREHDNPFWIVDLLRAIEAIKSSSEAKRLIESHAVSIDGEIITDFQAKISWRHHMTIKVGKHRIYKLNVI